MTGYAVGTVSRVLNNHPNVSEKARQAILKAVEESGFELNVNAKQLKQQHSNTVLVVVKGYGNELFAKMVEQIQTLFAKTPYPLLVDYTSKQFALVESVTNEIFPGVIVSPYTMTGGTDAKFYKEICDNCIRFAPLYIDKQQYGSIHALNENISQGALPHAVDFYKQVICRAKEIS